MVNADSNEHENTSEYRAVWLATASTVLAAIIGWAGLNLVDFVSSVYDLRHTVEGRGKLLSGIEEVVNGRKDVLRQLESHDRELVRISSNCNTLLGEVKQALLSKDELDRERARLEVFDTKAAAYREYTARMFGSLEQKLSHVERRLEEVERNVGRKAR